MCENLFHFFPSWLEDEIIINIIINTIIDPGVEYSDLLFLKGIVLTTYSA